MPPKKKSKRMSVSYKPATLIANLQAIAAKERENKLDKFTHESNMQFLKQRLEKIKGVMEESDFQLQTKTRTKKLELAFKNTEADDLPDETETEGDDFMSEINQLLKLEDGLKKQIGNVFLARSTLQKQAIETSESHSFSSKSFKITEGPKQSEFPATKKGPEIHISEGENSPGETGRKSTRSFSVVLSQIASINSNNHDLKLI